MPGLVFRFTFNKCLRMKLPRDTTSIVLECIKKSSSSWCITKCEAVSNFRSNAVQVKPVCPKSDMKSDWSNHFTNNESFDSQNINEVQIYGCHTRWTSPSLVSEPATRQAHAAFRMSAIHAQRPPYPRCSQLAFGFSDLDCWRLLAKVLRRGCWVENNRISQ